MVHPAQNEAWWVAINFVFFSEQLDIDRQKVYRMVRQNILLLLGFTKAKKDYLQSRVCLRVNVCVCLCFCARGAPCPEPGVASGDHPDPTNKTKTGEQQPISVKAILA